MPIFREVGVYQSLLFFVHGLSFCLFSFGFMVFNTTFNNISVILWQSLLLVKETGVHGKNHRPVTSH